MQLHTSQKKLHSKAPAPEDSIGNTMTLEQIEKHKEHGFQDSAAPTISSHACVKSVLQKVMKSSFSTEGRLRASRFAFASIEP